MIAITILGKYNQASIVENLDKLNKYEKLIDEDYIYLNRIILLIPIAVKIKPKKMSRKSPNMIVTKALLITRWRP